MRITLEKKLGDLKSEFESGKNMLADMETKQENLKQTLLRISGAIQVLEELLREISTEDDQKTGEAGDPS